ncbi:MAG: diguanylate cyclase domain-containing protein, partial [Vicinamibacteria bacterium]
GELHVEKRGNDSAFHVTLPILREEMILEHEIDLVLSQIRKDGSALALILIEMNLTKSTFGRPAKERVRDFRSMVLERIRSFMRRPTDQVFEHRSGQLTAVILETNRKGARGLVQRMKTSFVGEQFMIGDRPFGVRPRTGVACYPEDAMSAKELIEKAEGALRDKTVMLLSKSSDVFKDLAARLTEENYEVITCVDSNEVLETARKKKPHLLITEPDPPGLSAYEVIGVLKMNPETADIPVIIFSALDPASAPVSGLPAAEIPSVPQAAGLDPLMEKVEELL